MTEQTPEAKAAHEAAKLITRHVWSWRLVKGGSVHYCMRCRLSEPEVRAQNLWDCPGEPS